MLDKHKGETCVITGNGVSLRDVPDDFLHSFPLFGTNRCYLRFVPDYYVAVNPLVIKQNRADIEAMDTVKFIRAGLIVNCHPLQNRIASAFSFEPLVWINEGYTVTYVCMQLAFFMGFETVLLVGIDHRYDYKGAPNSLQKLETDDPNHFDPRYFKGQEWNAPDLAKSEKFYKVARDVFESAGRRIINLTPNTALDVFEKEELSAWKLPL